MIYHDVSQEVGILDVGRGGLGGSRSRGERGDSHQLHQLANPLAVRR